MWTVVICDDFNLYTRQAKEIILKSFPKEDIEVFTFDDPYIALSEILRREADIVILDRVMPLNGDKLLTMILESYRPHSIMMSMDPIVNKDFDYVINKDKLPEELPRALKNIFDGKNRGYLRNSDTYEFLKTNYDFNTTDMERLEIILATMEKTGEKKFNKILEKSAVAFGVDTRTVRRYITLVLKSSACERMSKKPKDFIIHLYEHYLMEKTKKALAYKPLDGRRL